MMERHDGADDLGVDFLLVKRGHRGRYRIALRLDDVRVTGEVTVESSRTSKSNDAVAIRRFREALSTLAERLETAQVKP